MSTQAQVNAAATLGLIEPIETMDIDKWRKVFFVNVEGPLNIMGAALPGMYAEGFGHIINLTSMAGEYGAPKKSAYVSSKHALFGLTKSVALEAAGTGVTCNAVAPSWVGTEFSYQQFEDIAKLSGTKTPEEVAARIVAPSALGRLITPMEVATVVANVMQSGVMTGTRIAVDGGISAGSFNMLKDL